MKKFDIKKQLSGIKSPKFLINSVLILFFAIVFTGILVSKYFFFQTIVGSDNTSKITVTAPKDIEVVEIEKYAHTLLEKCAEEYGAKVLIGISAVVEGLKDLAKAYKEARISIEVGKVFDIEKPIMSYESLGIGRLIYQLPITLCEIFLGEVFKKGALETLDRETLMTVQAFFENNLNVSETSRKLFVHRNTLVYRLEKIKKIELFSI